MCAAKGCVIVFPSLLSLGYPWAGLHDELACTQRPACSLCSHPNPFNFGRITGRDPTYRWGLSPGPKVRDGITSAVHTCSIKNTNKTVMNKQELFVLTVERAAPVAYGYAAKMWHWTSSSEPELESLPIQPGLLPWLRRSGSCGRPIGWLANPYL